MIEDTMTHPSTQATNLPTTRPHPSDFEARKETWQAPFSGFPRSLRFG